MADLEVAVRLEARGLDVSCAVAEGEVLAVIGANGSGKSTLAAVIAGLLGADHAIVRVGGCVLTDTGAGVAVPAHRRRIGLLQQNPLLFPHLSVARNVAFGSRAGAEQWLRRVGVEDLADRMPGQLSGGQAQRVAIARALAAEPEVVILDEPLSGLDVAAAASVRSVLRDVLTGTGRAVVLITHDLPDVVELADRVLVLEDGKAVEEGPVADVLAAPRSRFGARTAGLNLVRGTVRATGVLRNGQLDWHGVEAEPLAVGQNAVAVFPPSAVAVFRETPHGSPRNVIPGRIAAIEATGAGFRVRLDAGQEAGPGLAADVTAPAVAELRLKVGEQVWFAVKSQLVNLHPVFR